MLIARIKFGQTHAVTSMGDVFKGEREIDLACTPGIKLTKANRDRYLIFDNTGEHVACPACRRITGLDKDEENAD